MIKENDKQISQINYTHNATTSRSCLQSAKTEPI